MPPKKSPTLRAGKFALTLFAAALSLAAHVEARADTATFNFEGLTPTTGGALTSLTQTQGALSLTITRESGVGFDVINTTAFGFAAAYGTRALDPFNNTGATAFIGNFSQSVTSVSIDMGDFVASDLDSLLIQAFSGPNGTGSLISSAAATCCATGSGFVFTTLTVTGSGINSIRFIGGSTAFPNSVYYDNIRVEFNQSTAPVPEPATMLLLSTGLAGVGAAVRKRRRKG